MMDNQFQRSFQHYALLKPPRKIIEIHAKITKAWSQAFQCSPAVLGTSGPFQAPSTYVADLGLHTWVCVSMLTSLQSLTRFF